VQCGSNRAILALAIGLCAFADCSHRSNTDGRPGAGLTKESGAIDLEPGALWNPRCQIHRPCEAIKPLQPCPAEMKTSVVPVPIAFPEDEGNDVILSVAGRLFQDQTIESTAKACSSATAEQLCCNRTSQEAHLAGEPGIGFKLPKLGCFGDESRLCCNIIVTGQRVVATGIATIEGQGAGQRAFFKGSVTLCAL